VPTIIPDLCMFAAFRPGARGALLYIPLELRDPLVLAEDFDSGKSAVFPHREPKCGFMAAWFGQPVGEPARTGTAAIIRASRNEGISLLSRCAGLPGMYRVCSGM